MDLSSLHLTRGPWLAMNCGRFPSETKCQLVLMAPAHQRDDLIDAAAAHAVTVHGHDDTPELRRTLGTHLEHVGIA